MNEQLSKSQKIFIGIAALLGFCIWAGFYVYDEFKPRHRAVDGTLVALDAASRTATLSFIHPKSGESMTLKGTVAEDCEILIDGNPQSLGELRAGMQATVEATVRSGSAVTATRIAVRTARSSADESAAVPASSRADSHTSNGITGG